MNKRFFDPALYREGLRQTRLMGLIFLILLELEAVLVPVGYFINARQLTEPTIVTLSFWEMHPLLVLCFLVLAPLMTLNLFHFLNKRSSSDFYHALPNTRVSLFVSFFLAILTWIALVIVVTSLTSLAGFALLGSYVHVNLASVFTMMFNMFAASVLVAASVAAAMFVTGTLFTNVVVSLLLLFMPRLLIFVFTDTLSTLLPLLAPGQFLPPLDARYNILTSGLFSAFLGIGGDSLFSFLPGGIYTLGLGLLYTVGAAALFRIRRSEIAGSAATNRVLQTLFRLMIAMLVCLIPCVMIVNDILYSSVSGASELFLYIVLYIAALLVYFLYELITTRKWRNLVRSLPALGILVVMNALFICGLTGAYYSVLSYTPDMQEIESVSLVSENEPAYGDRSLFAYFARKTDQVRHTDEAIRSIVAERLQYTAAYVREGRWRYRSYEQEEGGWQQVAIHQPGRTVYRNILLRESDRTAIARRLAHNDAFRQAYLTLPALGEHGTTVSSNWLTPEQSRALYQTMREELRNADFKDWYLYLKGYMDETDLLPSFNLLTDSGTESDSLSVSVPPFLSRTTSLYLQYINANNADAVLDALRSGSWSSDDSLQIYTLHMDPYADGSQADRYLSGDTAKAYTQELSALAQTLDTPAARSPSIDKPLYILQVHRLPKDKTEALHGYTSEAYLAYLQAPSPALPAFLRDMDDTVSAVPTGSRWTEAYAG